MKNVSYYRHLHPESLKKLVAITKITAVSLLTVLPSTMQAEPTYSQSVVISIKTERMLLTDLFSQIEKQSEFLFFYVDKDVADIKVNIKANSNQIDEILTQALAGTGLTYTINDRNINIMRKAYARQQQTKQITGKVLDSNGDPIIGANVVEKGRDHAQKIHPQVEDRTRQQVHLGVQQPQHGRGAQQPHNQQDHACDLAEDQGRVVGVVDFVRVSGSVVAGDQHGDAVAQADEKASEQRDKDAGGAHRAQRCGARKPPHHGHVRHIE